MLKLHGGSWRVVGAADFSRLHEGFPPGGAQDRFSCQLANRLLGNDGEAGALEFTMLAPEIEVCEDCWMVIGGAPCEITSGVVRMARWRVHRVLAGERLKIRFGVMGCRIYLAVAGGLDEEAVGGLLRAAGEPFANIAARHRRLLPSSLAWEPAYGHLRATLGAEGEPAMRDALAQRWTVGQDSDGMGVRLSGASLSLPSYDLVSSPVTDGSVQATPQGLIALLRERGTLGGYPRVANIIDCDVDRLAQLRPGNRVSIDLVAADEAKRLCRLQREALEFLADGS